MHRIDGDAQYPAGHFSEGDPSVPRLPTQVTAAWLDNVQEELATLVTTAGAALVKGTAQLQGLLANLSTAQTFTAFKTFSAGLSAATSTFTGLLTASSGLLAERSGASDLSAACVASGATSTALRITQTGGATSKGIEVVSGAAPSLVADGTLQTSGAVVANTADLTGSATRAPLSLNTWVEDLPTAALPGSIVVRTIAGVPYLYHLDAGPNYWSRVALTPQY